MGWNFIGMKTFYHGELVVKHHVELRAYETGRCTVDKGNG